MKKVMKVMKVTEAMEVMVVMEWKAQSPGGEAEGRGRHIQGQPGEVSEAHLKL